MGHETVWQTTKLTAELLLEERTLSLASKLRLSREIPVLPRAFYADLADILDKIRQLGISDLRPD